MTGQPLILLWATAWIDVDEARLLVGDSCTVSEDRGDHERADVVIFPTPVLGDRLPSERAFPHQHLPRRAERSGTRSRTT